MTDEASKHVAAADEAYLCATPCINWSNKKSALETIATLYPLVQLGICTPRQRTLHMDFFSILTSFNQYLINELDQNF
jgi:hypothetical protein